MNLYPVSISLGSYGADYVRAQGQASLIPVLSNAGVSHMELREELFVGETDLHALGRSIASAGLTCVYSAPIELWLQDQSLPNPAVAKALQSAQDSGAVWLKVSLGHFNGQANFSELAALLDTHPVHLLVENDQTPQGGHIAPLVDFFGKVRSAGLGIGMTFDIGNWQWQGESAVDAAQQLGGYVEYLHCKAVERRNGKLCAIPPTAADLQLWEHLLQGMAPGIVRAVEFPLQGDDLTAVTQGHVAALARLGQLSDHDQVQREHAHG